MKTQLRTLAVMIVFVCAFAKAQINKPSLSPTITTVQKVGLAKITLEYGQPSMQGREIFGSLIPYGKLWRTGANASTKFTTDKDIVIGMLALPAGTYGVYSIPQKQSWTLIFHKNAKLWGAGNYRKDEEFGRIIGNTNTLKDTRETLSLSFENFTTDGAFFTISWENTQVKVPVIVDSDAIILEEITAKITNATGDIAAQTYFDAAQFYQFKNIDLDQAVKWYDKAINMRPEAFWYKYYRAEVALLKKEYSVARKFAQQSLKQAKALSPATDFGYIAKNELLLNKLK